MSETLSSNFIIFILLNILIIIGVIIVIELKRKNKVQKNKADTNEDTVSMSKGLMDYAYNITKMSTDILNDKNQFVQLLQIINSSFSLLTKADGAILLTTDSSNESLQTRAYDGFFPPAVQVSKSLQNNMIGLENYYNSNNHSMSSVFGTVVDLGQPEIIVNVVADKRIYVNEVDLDEKVTHDFSSEESMQYLKASSYIFIPLKCNLTTIGVVGLARKYQSETFTTQDFEAAKILSKFVNSALNNVNTFDTIGEEKNAMLQSTIASDIQKQIFCQNYPYLPNMSIDSYFYGAEGVCSDYFDIIQARKDRVCFFLADVLGRGMKSLMLITMIRGISRILANTTQSGATILSWINKGITQDKSMVNFANISFVDYNPLTNVVRCSSAGSGVILYFDAENKTWDDLAIPSEPAGIDLNTVYTDIEKTLKPNDIIAICTDGIVETVNSIGYQYGQDRLKEKIQRFASFSTKEITEKIKLDILDFEGNIRSNEDRSLVILKGKQK